MKLLPKQQLDDRLNEQKKSEIDAGLFLARKIDALREDLADTQKEHDDKIASLNKEFIKFTTEMTSKKGEIEKQIIELEENKRLLMIPLDEAWKNFNERNEKLVILEDEMILKEHSISERINEINKKEKELSDLKAEIEMNKSDTERLMKQANVLKEMNKKEYNMTVEEKENNKKEYENSVKKLFEKENQYNVALHTLEINKKSLEEKESELIIRENHLASQQVSLRIAYEKIKNGNSSTTNNTR